MKWVPIIVLFLFAGCVNCFAQAPNYRANTIIFKMKDAHRSRCSDGEISQKELNRVFSDIGVDRISRKFQHIPIEPSKRNLTNQTVKTDISLIYELHYSSDYDVRKAIGRIYSTGVVEYAEPAFIAEVLAVPNDPKLYKQWHLEAIHAYEAWDIDTGDSNVIIAIIDTGTDWDHLDLVNAIFYNDLDPIDGKDNDSNGYIDDYRGWNFYDNNNDPDELSWSHGTHVSGLAAASTNNGIDGAGTSYSCRILPIKAGDKIELTHGYEGIVYAVSRGVDIINCSWGSTSYTEFGHDIVNYATEKGMLVVCGAGNNNNDYDFYPASFPVAVSVAATDSLNGKAIFSTYNYGVDISAPGQYVYSTKNNDTFYYDNGTSMSSPIVAGAAALLKSRFPTLTPAQIKAQLMETVTNIDTVGDNINYQYRLGTGLLNMRASLESLVSTAIGMENYELTDNGDLVFVQGDQLKLGIELINYLGSTEAIEVTLESLDSIVTIETAVRQFPALSQNSRTNNFTNPFELSINDLRGYNEVVDLKLTIQSGDYVKYEFIRMLINPDFVNVTVNDVATTISSSGHVGYANNARTYGLGFEYSDQGSLLYEAGLMIGTKSFGYTKVADRVRGTDYVDRDFWPMSAVRIKPNQGLEAFRAKGVFNDTSATIDEIGLEIIQTVTAYNDEGHRNYVIVEYSITNVSDRDLTDVYVGMYADWDVVNAIENRGETAYAKRLGYVYSSSENQLVGGIQQLNVSKPFYSYMIDNSNNGSGGIDISTDGFSTDEKFISLTSNQFDRGEEGLGTDVSHVVSTGGYSIEKGDSIKVAFAFMAANSVESVLSVADSAFKRYNGFNPGDFIFKEFQLVSLSPNPTTGAFRLSFDLKNESNLSFELYDNQGVIVSVFPDQYFFAGPNIHDLKISNRSAGTYFVKIRSENFERTLPIALIKP